MQKGCGKFVVQYHTSVWMCRVPISNQMQLFDKTRTTLESDRRFIEFKSSSLFCIPANAFTVLIQMHLFDTFDWKWDVNCACSSRQ